MLRDRKPSGELCGATMLIIAALVPYAQAAAAEPTGFIAAGVAANPDYEGSADYQAVPFITSRYHAGRLSLEFEGLTARAHLKPPSWIEAGVSVNYRFGRDDAVNNARVSRLNPIDNTIEAGAFFRIELDELWLQRDELALQIEPLWDVGSAHDGWTATLSASYAIRLNGRWRLAFGAESTYADGNYLSTYFNVDTDSAAASGLPTYEAGSGFKDIGANLTAMRYMNGNLGIMGRFAYTRLIGEAADSPVVGVAGDPNQWFVGLSVLYRF